MSLEIVQIVQEFSTVGGVETVAWELARVFSQTCVANSVICRVAAPGSHPRIETVARAVAAIPTRGRLGRLGRLIVVPWFSVCASLALRRHRDVVALSHGDSLSGDIYVAHAVNIESLAMKRAGGEWRYLLNPLHLWVTLRDRWMINGLRYAVYVAVSQRIAEELKRHHGVPADRIRIIPNGVDTERFRLDPAVRPAVRREFGLDEATRLMLFVGHEFRRKGLIHVIRALPRLPDVALLVVGSDDPGLYRETARQLGVADRVIFAGERRDLPALYVAADVFVLPTAYEAFGLVGLEAMASGIPVLATAVGGIEDYLVDGENGYFIRPDSDDIAAAAQRLFDDDERRRAMAVEARRTAERLSWSKIAERYVDLATEIATRRARPLG